jgi:hypothetical protein
MAPGAKAAPRALSLTVITGPSPGESFSKPGLATLKLGRVKTGNTFSFKSPSVSSKHAELVWDDSVAAGGGTWFLVDVGSTNGTQLNGNAKCLEGARAAAARAPPVHSPRRAAAPPACGPPQTRSSGGARGSRSAPPRRAMRALLPLRPRRRPAHPCPAPRTPTPLCARPAGQRYPLRDQDIIHLGPDTQLQVTIDAPEGATAGMTVEQKLTAEAERAAASIQVRVCARGGAAGARAGLRFGGDGAHQPPGKVQPAARAWLALSLRPTTPPPHIFNPQAAAAAMAAQMREDWRAQRQELEALLSAC